MLIKCYGQFWNPDVIEWGSDRNRPGTLLGVIKKGKRNHTINFWKAKGIYVLHANYRAVYVGRANGSSIGARLRDHLTDRHAGRWDMFSWYSISIPCISRKDVSRPGQRQLKPEVMVNSLEALAILIADPALNRRREKLKDAYEASQPDGAKPKAIRTYLEEILRKIPESS